MDDEKKNIREKKRMMRLLQFGMKNWESKNLLIRIAARICLYLTGKWADWTERRLNRKWKEIPGWTPKKAEEIKRKILKALETHRTVTSAQRDDSPQRCRRQSRVDRNRRRARSCRCLVYRGRRRTGSRYCYGKRRRK